MHIASVVRSFMNFLTFFHILILKHSFKYAIIEPKYIQGTILGDVGYEVDRDIQMLAWKSIKLLEIIIHKYNYDRK